MVHVLLVVHVLLELRNRLRYVKHGGVPLPRSGIRSGTRGGTASGRVRGDLRITVRASPSGVPLPSSTPQLAGVPLDRTGPLQSWVLHPFPSVLPLMTRFPLRGRRLGCVVPFGCGNAFLGRRERRARVESSTVRRASPFWSGL